MRRTPRNNTCRARAPGRTATRITSTSKPAPARRRSKRALGPDDHTASTPAGPKQRWQARRPCSLYRRWFLALESAIGPLSTSSRITSKAPRERLMDSKGRLFVGDRSNNRIQIFDQDGKFLEEWKQFGRPSGIFIDKNDIIYVADSESNTRRNSGWKRGIRIGSARNGKVTAFIPDPEPNTDSGPGAGTSAAEGVATDAQGNVYGAEVGPRALKKYVKK